VAAGASIFEACEAVGTNPSCDDSFVSPRSCSVGLGPLAGTGFERPFAGDCAQGAATRRQATAANEKAEKAHRLAATVADSVGPKNGHGTVQDATGVLIDEFREWRKEVSDELHATRTTVEMLVTSASTVNDRLKDHDREHAGHRRRDRDHDQKILELDARLRERPAP